MPCACEQFRPRASFGFNRMIGVVLLAWMLVLVAMLFLTGCGDGPEAPPPRASTGAAADATARYAQQGQRDEALTLTIVPAAHPAPRPDKPLPADASCVTSECHADLVTAAYVHGPVGVGSCDACHDRDAGGHTYPLKRDAQATCQFCHPVAGNEAFQHQPVHEAGCMACHDPHMSPTKYLLVKRDVQQLCTECHQMPTGGYQHAPFALGECTLCHAPHEANNQALLRGGDGPNHCYTCHDDKQIILASANYTHEPAREGCVNCHDPHATPFAHHFRQPMAEGCLACHEDTRKHLAEANFPHGAISDERSCANCHDAHASQLAHLVSDREEHLCLECHDQPLRSPAGRWIRSVSTELSRPYLHGPIRHGDCGACHDPHGENRIDLLRADYPDAFYASFEKDRYELCFTCHTEAMVMTPQTTTLTGFRNADQNLHYVHVNRDEKGRTCRTCHEIHGSDRPRHIAEAVPFEGSTWAMPIGFKKTDAGGSCSPGCHEPATYDRDAVAQPEAPANPQDESAVAAKEPAS